MKATTNRNFSRGFTWRQQHAAQRILRPLTAEGGCERFLAWFWLGLASPSWALPMSSSQDSAQMCPVTAALPTRGE